jgi:DNA-directed RNA polymerase alpha subunit
VVLRTSNDGIESLEQITQRPLTVVLRTSNDGRERIEQITQRALTAKLSIPSFDVLSSTVNGLCDLF